jgi:hypothetical protein
MTSDVVGHVLKESEGTYLYTGRRDITRYMCDEIGIGDTVLIKYDAFEDKNAEL